MAKRSLRLCFRCFITFALIFVTQSRTASFNSAKEKKRLLRSLPSRKRETMPTAASTLALSRGRRTRAGQHDEAVVIGEILIRPVDARLVARWLRDAGFEIGRHRSLWRTAQEVERVDVRTNPIGQRLAPARLGVGV